MKLRLLITAAAVLLAGCAQTVTLWHKPGATDAEDHAIGNKCKYEAEAHSEEGMTDEWEREERVHKLLDLCLKANGMIIEQRGVPAAKYKNDL